MTVIYSEEFKKAAVQKYLSRGNRSAGEILNELGITKTSIYQWRNNFANVNGMKKSSKPQNRTVHEKLKALTEFDALPVDGRGEYLRKNGLHTEHLDEWRKYIEEALSPAKMSLKERQDKSADKKKIKDLERELRRKDKALAEASALLILKKKADLIWGSQEEEE